MKRRRTSRKDENNEKPVKSKYFIQQPHQQQKHQPQQQQQYQPQQHQPQQQQHLQEQNSGSVKSRDSTATTTTTTTSTRKQSRKDFEKPGLEISNYLLGKVIIRKNKSVKVENKKV